MSILVGQVLERAPDLEVGRPELEQDPIAKLTVGWLWSFSSPHTRRAYERNLLEWLDFCSAREQDPLTVTRGAAWKLEHSETRALAPTGLEFQLSGWSSNRHELKPCSPLTGRNIYWHRCYGITFLQVRPIFATRSDACA
jgi:hypothetical protein